MGGKSGESLHYSFFNMNPRWQVEGDGSGWAWVLRLMVNLVKLILQRPYPDEMEPDVRVIHTTHDLEDKIVCDYMKMGWRVEAREEV